MKRPKPKTQRYVAYYDGQPVGEIMSTSRMDAWQDCWKRHGRGKNLDSKKFAVHQEDRETKQPA